MRTIFIRSLQNVLTFAAVALLTGANAGCGLATSGEKDNTANKTSPVTVDSSTVDPLAPLICPSGTVLQLVCDPSGGGSGIPAYPGNDDAPPPFNWDPTDGNSAPPYPSNDTPVCNPADPGCDPTMPCGQNGAECPTPPLPPGCSYECVPPDPVCPPGTDPVMSCWGSDDGPGGNDDGGGCSFECVPTGPVCPPGTDPLWSCEGSVDGGGCSYECVPTDPVCPPFTDPVTVCEDSVDGSDGTAGGSPSIPPGGPDTPVSNPICWTECVPTGPVCPPGTDPVTMCEDSVDGSDGTAGGNPSIPPGGPDTPVSNPICWTECVPHGCGGDDPTEPPQPE